MHLGSHSTFRFSEHTRGIGSALAAIICFSSYTVFSKYLLTYFEPHTIALIVQMVAAVVIVLLLGIFPELKKLRTLSVRELIAVFGVSVLSAVVGPLLLLEGLRTTPATDVILVDVAQPILTVVLASVLLKEKTTLRQKIGVIVMFFGVYAVSTKGFTYQIHWNGGITFVLLSCFAWAFAEIIFKRFLKHISPDLMVLMRNVIGALVLLFVAPLFLNIGHDFTGLGDQRLLAMVVVFSLVTIVLAQFLWYESLELIPVTVASIITLSQPLFGVLIATLALREPLYLYHLYGGICIMAGLALTVRHMHVHPRQLLSMDRPENPEKHHFQFVRRFVCRILPGVAGKL